MQNYQCACGNTVFYDNSQCVACGKDLGFCPTCRNIVSLLSDGSGQYTCGNLNCGAALAKCQNYAEHNVCNRCVTADAAGSLCDCCRFNDTIPDLTVAGNWEKWRLLESAKRRLFYDLDELGLPYGKASDQVNPPLTFDFKADVIPGKNFWRSMGKGKVERVYTGHAAGRITINIKEADDVEREKLRVDFGEAHRTLIGHFRHEIGHYYWDQLVKGRREDECREVFGDHDSPTYAEALERYYKDGAPADWAQRHVSAYATMHPWEDFAETWATYLDMISGLDTAQHVGFGGETEPIEADVDDMVKRYQQLGIALNEVNRSMGLLDVVPEIFVDPVVVKLRFIHQLVRAGRAENGALGGQPPVVADTVAASADAPSANGQGVVTAGVAGPPQ